MAKANFKTKVVEHKADKKKSAFVKISPCNCKANRVVDLYKWVLRAGAKKAARVFALKQFIFNCLVARTHSAVENPRFVNPTKILRA